MNYKTIAMKFSMPLILAGLMFGNAAWAEEAKDVATLKCKIIPGTKALTNGAVLEFGDLKLLVKSAYILGPNTNGYAAGRRTASRLQIKVLGVNGYDIYLSDRDPEKKQICGQEVNFGMPSDKLELTVSVW